MTLTIAHHALRENHRGKTIFWLLATVVLGFIFWPGGGIPSCLYRAEPEVQLGASSLFYMLTGFTASTCCWAPPC